MSRLPRLGGAMRHRGRPDRHRGGARGFMGSMIASCRWWRLSLTPNSWTHRSTETSVPIQKFLSSLSVNLERAVAKALDGRQNIVCRLGPAQGFRVLIVLCNEGLDDCDQLIDRLVSTPFDLFLGDKSEEALHLIDP